MSVEAVLVNSGVRGDDEECPAAVPPVFVILSITEKVARLGGLYRREYRPSHGTGLADALIAATAEEKGLSFISFNRRHFPMVYGGVVPYDRLYGNL